MKKFFAGLLIAFAALALAFDANAASLRGKHCYGFEALYQGTNDLGTPQIEIPAAACLNIATGTGDYQANVLYSDTRTLGPSGTEDIDLAGALDDPLGNTFTMVEVTGVLIIADAANTNNVVVGNATQAAPLGFGASTHTWAVPPGGWMSVGAPEGGWTIGAGATDDIKILNSGAGTSVTYTIIVFGRDA
jgi:hypothetical protein